MAQGNDAIVQIKNNHKYLFEAVKDAALRLEPVSSFVQKETRKRNRIEYRQTLVFELPREAVPKQWRGLFKSIIQVRRYTDILNPKNQKWSLRTEASYYGSTCLLQADQAATSIRAHWHIENKNHYVRDVSLGEDASRIRKNPGVFARLRSFALNILRKNNITNVKEALFENALNFQNILNYKGIF